MNNPFAQSSGGIPFQTIDETRQSLNPFMSNLPNLSHFKFMQYQKPPILATKPPRIQLNTSLFSGKFPALEEEYIRLMQTPHAPPPEIDT